MKFKNGEGRNLRAKNKQRHTSQEGSIHQQSGSVPRDLSRPSDRDCQEIQLEREPRRPKCRWRPDAQSE